MAGFGLISTARRMIRRCRSILRPGWIVQSWNDPGDLRAARMVLDSVRILRLAPPDLRDAPQQGTILVIAPHPDDEIIGPGGTILQSKAAGASVCVLYLTTGRASERQTREAEARAMCSAAGFTPLFAGFDADTIPFDAAVKAIADTLLTTRPATLFLPFLLDDHDDHRLASALLRQVLRGAGRDLAPEIWCYQVYGIAPLNAVVDITAQTDQKAVLIHSHASQNTRRDWAHFTLGLNAVMSRFLATGGQKRYAEGFLVLPGDQWLDLIDRVLPEQNAGAA